MKMSSLRGLLLPSSREVTYRPLLSFSNQEMATAWHAHITLLFQFFPPALIYLFVGIYLFISYIYCPKNTFKMATGLFFYFS